MSSGAENGEARAAVAAELWRQYEKDEQKDIFRAVRYGAGTLEDGQDARQDAYIKAWEHLGNFNGEAERLKPWVNAIIINRSRDMARKRNAQHRITGELEVLDDGFLSEKIPDNSIETADDIDLRLRVADIIGELPERLKGVVELELQGFRNPEIVEITGMTYSATGKRKFLSHVAIRESHPELAEG